MEHLEYVVQRHIQQFTRVDATCSLGGHVLECFTRQFFDVRGVERIKQPHKLGKIGCTADDRHVLSWHVHHQTSDKQALDGLKGQLGELVQGRLSETCQHMAAPCHAVTAHHGHCLTQGLH